MPWELDASLEEVGFLASEEVGGMLKALGTQRSHVLLKVELAEQALHLVVALAQPYSRCANTKSFVDDACSYARCR